MDSHQKLDYFYREYSRLSDKAEEHIKSSFDDFKLLGAIGAIVVLWKPIVDTVISPNLKLDYSKILFLGFVSLLLVIEVIAFLNLVRQSYIYFIVYNLQHYEKRIKTELNEELSESQIFSFNTKKNSSEYLNSIHLPYAVVVVISVIAVAFIPFVILLYWSNIYAVIYLLIVLISSILYIQVYLKITSSFLRQSKQLTKD